nr:RNA polymerase sigma-54 factor RpoN [uncultured bacterium]
MKAKLQTSLGQQLVLTPQLRQAIHLLQLSAVELEQELATAVESNPLLDWAEPEDDSGETESGTDDEAPEPWTETQGSWTSGGTPGGDDNAADRVAEPETLHDHLLWQLHLSHLSPRDRHIGMALIDAIDDDGYLREPLEAIAQALLPETTASVEEVKAVLHQVQRMDPPGVGARDLGECLALQLGLIDPATPGKALALRIADGLMDRLQKAGVAGLASELRCEPAEVETALALLRTLDPRPGGGIGAVAADAKFAMILSGAVAADAYVTPDCTIWRQHGVWRVALSGNATRLTIHRGYESMIGAATGEDASYLRAHLQEARWLLRNLQARGETLLRVAECLVHQQSGFLEFGDQALRPLTLREVAAELDLHESTISRAVSRKYVRTPRGTLPLRAFFASGIATGGGGEASSTAIQSMIRSLIGAEDPRKPLSDARLAKALAASGIPVARRTVAKYREGMNIPSSHDRVRVG